MSDNNSDIPAQPLVIVRRRRCGEESHHGGVWKIAYADFMTAMMAFFLVMWLVNAADKKTIVQVAAYFNPMRLTDRTAATTGLEDQTDQPKKERKNKTYAEKMKEDTDPKDKEDTSKSQQGSLNKKVQSSPDGEKAEEESAMMQEPQKVLQKIVDEGKSRRRGQQRNSQDPTHDPFDLAAGGTSKGGPTSLAEFDQKIEMSPHNASDRTRQKAQVAAAWPAEKTESASAKPAGNKPSGKAGNKQEHATDVDELANEIRKASSDRAGVDSRNFEVKSVPEGILVSLIDDARNGMFEIGSAKPSADTILMLERIATIIGSRKGRILVRGHTDGRSFRGGLYDNWRLSTARAHMTMQMLIRGGLSEERFVGIEGRGDRDLRNPADKEDAQNRRIDILIKDETS